MSKTLEFYYDFGSPTTYLAHKALPGITERTGAKLVYKPILLGGIFKGASNQSPVMVPAKGAWMLKDLARWAEKWGAPLNFNPHFPINTLPLMRGAIGLSDDERAGAYRNAVFNAIWVDQKNMGDPAVIGEVVEAAGIPADEFQKLASDAAVNEKLKIETEAALTRGIFGAPTFFIGETMHFGQDRLHFVEEDLSV